MSGQTNDATSALTIRLPEELHDRLRILSFIDGIPINELIVSALYDKYVTDPRIEAIRKLIEEVRDERKRKLSSRDGTSGSDQ